MAEKKNFPEFWNFLYDRNIDTIKKFLEKGQDPDFRTNNNLTALHLVSSSGEIKIANLLLKYRAKIDLKDNGERTPLHHASIEFRKDIIELLLKNKADPNLKDSKGFSPLHYIISLPMRYNNDPRLQSRLKFKDMSDAENNILEILKLFERTKVDYNLQDENKATPLHLAVVLKFKKLYDYLIKIGADNKIKDKYGKTPEDVLKAF